MALPSIAAELGLDGSAREWIVSGYALAFRGLLLLAGRAADLYGARRLFMAGLVGLVSGRCSDE